jgi:hypothetical protein
MNRLPKPDLPQPAPYKNPFDRSAQSSSLSPPASISQGGNAVPNSAQDHHSSDEHLSPNVFSVNSGVAVEADIVTQTPATNLPSQDTGPFGNFNWNFGYFEEINETLDVLNRAGGVNAQLDQLLNSFLSDTDHDFPMEIDATSKHDSENGLFRIPTSNEVPIDGMHSAPPPTKNIWKKLGDSRWAVLVLELAAIVSSLPTLSNSIGRNIQSSPPQCDQSIRQRIYLKFKSTYSIPPSSYVGP